MHSISETASLAQQRSSNLNGLSTPQPWPMLDCERLTTDFGLNVHVFPVKSSKQFNGAHMQACLTVPAGASFERGRNLGASHLIEHIQRRRMMDPSDHFFNQGLPAEGYTTRECSYFRSVGSIMDMVKFMKSCARLFTEFRPTLAELAVEKNRALIESYEADTRINDAFDAAALPPEFRVTPVCGIPSSIRSITPEELKLWHEIYYQPAYSNIAVGLPDDQRYKEHLNLISSAVDTFLNRLKNIANFKDSPLEMSEAEIIPVSQPEISTRPMTMRAGIAIPGSESPLSAEFFLTASILGAFDRSHIGLSGKLIGEGLAYRTDWGYRQYSNCGVLYLTGNIFAKDRAEFVNYFEDALEEIRTGEITRNDFKQAKSKVLEWLESLSWYHQAEEYSHNACVYRRNYLTDLSGLKERINELQPSDLTQFLDHYGKVVSALV